MQKVKIDEEGNNYCPLMSGNKEKNIKKTADLEMISSDDTQTKKSSQRTNPVFILPQQNINDSIYRPKVNAGGGGIRQ